MIECNMYNRIRNTILLYNIYIFYLLSITYYYYTIILYSGGSPVHLRSKRQELVGKTLWVKNKSY